MKRKRSVSKVISGGQIGVDIAALRAAEAEGVETGGFAPFGFMTLRGPTPELGTRYHLEVIPAAFPVSIAADYCARSKANANAGEATIAIRLSPRAGGTSRTIGYIMTGTWRPAAFYRENLTLDKEHRIAVVQSLPPEKGELEKMAREIALFLAEIDAIEINVCGERDVDEDTVVAFIREVIRESRVLAAKENPGEPSPDDGAKSE